LEQLIFTFGLGGINTAKLRNTQSAVGFFIFQQKKLEHIPWNMPIVEIWITLLFLIIPLVYLVMAQYGVLIFGVLEYGRTLLLLFLTFLLMELPNIIREYSIGLEIDLLANQLS
jgi:hypothetical protein